jgi:hypothetical protein
MAQRDDLPDEIITQHPLRGSFVAFMRRNRGTGWQDSDLP